MKKTLMALYLITSSLLFNPKQTSAAFVQFNPKNAQFVSPQDIKTSASKSAEVKPAAKPAVLGSAVISDSYIKGLVANTVNNMVAQGMIKGEKGDKGDPASFPTMDSIDPDSSDLRQVYIPGAVLAANQQTFLAATNLSGDNITVNSVNTGDLDTTGAFKSEGDASFSGNSSFASTTITDLNVTTIESPVSIANFDGYSWTNSSGRELKDNFATTSPIDILAKIDSMPIYSWNYKKDSTNVVHIGPVAEDFYNTFNLGNSSSSISTIDPAGVALAGIQGLDQKIKSILDFTSVLDGLKQLGMEIQNGFVKVQKFAADFISTKGLEVGSQEQPTGITIYDRTTGQPVCIYSDNNVLKSESGKCQAGLVSQNSGTPTQPENPVPAIPAEDLNATYSSETVSTTTPESMATSTPDLTLSNP